MSGEPHAQVRKALELAHAAPRCGARSRRNGGAPCRGPAIKGKLRCRMHGGLSAGPSDDGRRKLAAMRLKHGHRSRENKETRAQSTQALRTIGQVAALVEVLQRKC